MVKTWWVNNSWRFWQIRWAWESEPYAAVEIWQEYRHMLDPGDERGLVDQILQDYDKDTERAMKNPLVKAVFLVQGRLTEAIK